MTLKEIIKDAAAEHRDTVCCGFDDPIADAQEASFIVGAEWEHKRFVEQACQYLQKVFGSNKETQDLGDLMLMDLIADFRQEMEE